MPGPTGERPDDDAPPSLGTGVTGQGSSPDKPPTANRIVALALIAFAAAIAVQFAMIAVGIDRDNPFRLFVAPLIGTLIVYFGLRGYPRWGRVRLAAMVGLGVLFVSGAA